MLKRLITKLKLKKEKIEGPIIINPEYEFPNVDITSEEIGPYTQIYISDYITGKAYSKKTKDTPIREKLNLISFNIMWNNGKQKINKGNYYTISIGNRLYNFLINDEQITIDERTHFDNSTDEKIIKYHPAKNDFHYISFKHDEIGSTYYTKYYSKKEAPFSRSLCLTQEETKKDLNTLFEHLELLDNIETIIPLDTLKTEVLEYINNPNNKTKTAKK